MWCIIDVIKISVIRYHCCSLNYKAADMDNLASLRQKKMWVQVLAEGIIVSDPCSSSLS